MLQIPTPIIAIIDSDGSSKSTVARDIAKGLDVKIDTRLVYLSTGEGPSTLHTQAQERPKRAPVIEGVGPVSLATARKLSCDCCITTLLIDGGETLPTRCRFIGRKVQQQALQMPDEAQMAETSATNTVSF